MHLLIPYIRMNPPDPAFSEFTYGDVDQRARKLKNDVHRGDYLFFHTSKNGRKLITAYFVVDRVLDTVNACRDQAIAVKFKNPHIAECLANKRPLPGHDDVVVFGDPITSRVLDRPLLFNRNLASRLSLGIKFPDGKSDTQIIGSATRAWRPLTSKDVQCLLKAITKGQSGHFQPELRSTEEVGEVIERDIEALIARRPAIIAKGLKLYDRQRHIGDGRLDLLLEDSSGNLTIVEIKLGRIGHNALQQIRTYIHDLRAEAKRQVSGVIVCSGVMPAYEDEIRCQDNVRIFLYGWDL